MKKEIEQHEHEIAGRFRQVRFVNQLSQSAFGRSLGISRNQVKDIEYTRTPLRYDIAWKIRGFFGISIAWIDKGKFPPYQPDLDPWPNPKSLENPRELLSAVAETMLFANPADRQEAENKWFEAYRKDHSKFSMLTLASTSSMLPGDVKKQLPSLLERLNQATRETGKMSALAKHLNVPLASAFHVGCLANESQAAKSRSKCFNGSSIKSVKI